MTAGLQPDTQPLVLEQDHTARPNDSVERAVELPAEPRPAELRSDPCEVDVGLSGVVRRDETNEESGERP